MRGRPETFDVVLSADTLFISERSKGHGGGRDCLRPGGMLSFTVERWKVPSPTGVSGKPHMVGDTHTQSYVESALNDAGFSAIEIAPAVLRVELGVNVHGMVVVAGRVA